ncbi:MAG: prepilin-type N-terminal cleavage/methylation domain-containing protein [Patescibacteria group bacterium]
MSNFLKGKNNRKGFSLVEIVIYFSMLAVLTIVVISSLMSLFKSYSVIKLQQDIEASAIQVLDKMTRDIRDADGVVSAQSSFGVPEGSVALTITTDSVTDTYRYYVASSSVKVSKNGTYIGDLTQSSVTVNSLTAYEILGTSTHAIKLELNLQATPRYGTSTISENFYTTVQLRN